MAQKIALLWATKDLGLYSNSSFEQLYKGVGHNNGNLAFVYAIASQLDGDITYLPWHSKAEQLNKYDVIVIPCANQYGKHTDLSGLAELFSEVQIPIVAIGLGAQADNFDVDVAAQPGTIAWIKSMDARRAGAASNIYTRGPYTSRQLALIGVSDTVVGGCPSHFISPDFKLGETLQEKWKAITVPRAISVAGGHQSWAKVRTIEQQLIGLMMDPMCFGQYVVQSMGDMIKISRGLFAEIEPETLEKIRIHCCPHYSMDEFKAWCRNYVKSFYDVPSWMNSLSGFDLIVGPRYHGTQLAIQAGTMGVVVTIDSRTEELCSQTGVPYIRQEELADSAITRGTLKKLIKFDGAKYDKFRKERAGNYVDFLQANGLSVKPFLLAIAGRK